MNTRYKEQERFGPFQVLILGLSIYVLGALLVDTFFKLPVEVTKILNTVDHFICIFFLIDFLVRFFEAPDKWKFMSWGWVDLISSIPALDVLRAGRLLRVIRLLRILRAFKSTKVIVQHIFRNRTQGTFTAVALISVLLIIASSIAILAVERYVPNSNIKDAEDALWWAFVTITTVGYGDKYPVTTEGRIIASVLMVAGVGLFGVFTGFVASWFVEGKKSSDESINTDSSK